MLVAISGDSGEPYSRYMIPIGEKLSSRPFRISDSRPTSPFSAHFPREEKKRDTQRDTPRPTSPVHPGPLTTTTTLFVRGANLHNLLVRLVYQPSPQSAPVHIAPTHIFATIAIGVRSPQTPSTVLSSNIIVRCCIWPTHQIALWGNLPLMTGLVPPRPGTKFASRRSSAVPRMRLPSRLLPQH